MHETRAPGIRPDSTLQISLAKIDIPTPGSLPTSHVPHRTWTASPPEVGANSSVRTTRWTSPWNMDDRAGRGGSQQEFFSDMTLQDIKPC